MTTSGNGIHGSGIASLVKQAGPVVSGAIQKASASTGVDFSYLMEKAAAESNFDADAKAGTSSAAGLFQFIEKTWIGMVKNYGDKYGLSQYADKIGANGKVADAATRKEILELRNDPETASFMAAEFASENQRYLSSHVEGDVGATELYFAHFMGAGGASNFLNAMHKNPLQNAADLFPDAARANRNVFYDSKTGQSRTLAGVYEFFDKKFGKGGTDTGSIISASADMGNIAAGPRKTQSVSSLSDASSIGGSANRAMLWMEMQKDAISLLAPSNDMDGGSRQRSSSSFSAKVPTIVPRGGLTFSPVDIMMMANLDRSGSDNDKNVQRR